MSGLYNIQARPTPALFLKKITSGPTVIAKDDFNRANANPISPGPFATWGSGFPSANKWQIVSNVAIPATSSIGSFFAVETSGNYGGSNSPYTVQCDLRDIPTLLSGVGRGIGVCLYTDSTAGTKFGYAAAAVGNIGLGSADIYLYVVTGAVFGVLGASLNLNGAGTHTIKLTTDGYGTLKVYYDGYLQISVYDTVYALNGAGFYKAKLTGTNQLPVDNWIVTTP